MEQIVDFQSYCPKCCYFNESSDAEQYICAECSAIAKRERTSVPKYFIYKYKSKNSGRYPGDKIEKEGFCSVCAIEKGSPSCEKCKHKEDK